MGKRACLLAVGIAAVAINVHATTYYLSPDGDDGNDGRSAAAAFKTINGSLEENRNWFNAIYAVNSCAYPPPSDSRFRAADGCVTADPLFANASAGDYGLTVASPCKDTGTVESWMADAYDLAGAPRVFGAAPDMGCFERTYPLGTLLLFK